MSRGSAVGASRPRVGGRWSEPKRLRAAPAGPAPRSTAPRSRGAVPPTGRSPCLPSLLLPRTHCSSWNRTPSLGYRIAAVGLTADGSAAASHTVFADGWLNPNGQHWGRPVGLLRLPDGSLLVADDFGFTIYRIYYSGTGAGTGQQAGPAAAPAAADALAGEGALASAPAPASAAMRQLMATGAAGPAAAACRHVLATAAVLAAAALAVLQ